MVGGFARAPRKLVVCVAVVAGLSCCAAHAKHRPTLEDLESLRSPQHLKLSPDGKHLVYGIDQTMWIVDTGAGSKPRELGRGIEPAWAPDSRRLAYLGKKGEHLQLWILDVVTREVTQVTRIEGGINANPRAAHLPNFGSVSHGWSPDGTRIVFTSQIDGARVLSDAPEDSAASEAAPLILDNGTPRDWTLSGVFAHDDTDAIESAQRRRPPPQDSHLFVVDVRTGSVRQLTQDVAQYFEPQWSPDGRAIVCSSTDGIRLMPGSSMPVNLYTIEVGSGARRALTSGRGDRWLPQWSPDGNWIAFIDGEPNGKHSLFVISKDGRQQRAVTSIRSQFVYGFEWGRRNDRIAVNFIDDASIDLAWFDISTGAMSRISAPGATAFYITGARSGAIAWYESTPSSTGVLKVTKDGGPPRKVLDLNPQIIDWELGIQEVVRWRGLRGEARSGILIKPVGYRSGLRYPLIVDTYPQQVNAFMGYPMSGNQAWAAAGYAILFPNPRPPHFFRALSATEDQWAARGSRGWETAVADVLGGVEEVVRLGIADPERVALYGFSNGGGVVSGLVTYTDQFKCAVVVAPAMADWILPALLDDASGYAAFAGGISLWDDTIEYVRLSPVYRLKNASTPMLIAVGDADHYQFKFSAIALFNGLRAHSVPVTFLRYPQQGHGFTGEALRDFWRRQDDFFAQCLKQGTKQTETSTRSSPE